jgi:hypothetical protein
MSFSVNFQHKNRRADTVRGLIREFASFDEAFDYVKKMIDRNPYLEFGTVRDLSAPHFDECVAKIYRDGRIE